MRLCRCGKRLFEALNEGTCTWCGYGNVQESPVERTHKRPRLRRLPHNLGQIQAEGKRPDPHLDNVVRLNRLCDRWKVPEPAIDKWELAALWQQWEREAA